jgi:hypothetical protein
MTGEERRRLRGALGSVSPVTRVFFSESVGFLLELQGDDLFEVNEAAQEAREAMEPVVGPIFSMALAAPGVGAHAPELDGAELIYERRVV